MSNFNDRNENSITISNSELYNEHWLWVDVIDFWGCRSISQSYKTDNMEKSLKEIFLNYYLPKKIQEEYNKIIISDNNK